MIRKYKIINDEIIEETFFGGKRYETHTGIKAFYTKKEIMQHYKWKKAVMQKNLLLIGDKIYDDDGKGGLVTRKRVFLPEEICYIIECFGLP